MARSDYRRARGIVLWAAWAAVSSACGAGASSGEGPQTGVGTATEAGPPDARGGGVGGGETSATAPEVAWEWQGEDPSFGHTFYEGPVTAGSGGRSCSFAYSDEEHTTRLACEADGSELWRLEEGDAFMEDAALALDGGTLYVARFSDIASGCGVTAYEAASGEILWTTRLQGVGPIGHSEYLNKVELRVLDGRRLAAFGWESAGCYIEVLDREDGRTVVNRRLDPPASAPETEAE